MTLSPAVKVLLRRPVDFYGNKATGLPLGYDPRSLPCPQQGNLTSRRPFYCYVFIKRYIKRGGTSFDDVV